MLCTNCHGKCCNGEGCRDDCRDWTNKKWEKVSAYPENLAIQWEKRRAKFSSSTFSSLSSLSVMPIPSLKMQASSFHNVVTMTNASSSLCTTTFVTTSPYVSSKPISDSSKPSRKRKHSCSSLGFSHDEMWAEFQHFMSSHSAAGHPCHRPVLNHPWVNAPANQLSPWRDWPASLTHSTWLTSPARLVQPASSARPVMGDYTDRSVLPATPALPSSPAYSAWTFSPAHPAQPAIS